MNTEILMKSFYVALLACAVASPVGATELTVSAISTNKVYGEELALSDLQYILSISGTNGTEVVTGIDVSFMDESGAEVDPATTSVGTYKINLSNIQIQGVDPGSFSATYNPGELTILKRKITITPSDGAKTYGDAYSLFLNPKAYGLTDENGRKAKFIGSDGIISMTLTSEGSPATASWKKAYDILAKDAAGNGLENYDITYGTGTLYVAKYPITITANDATNAYGQASNFTGTEFSVNPAELPNGDRIETVTLTNRMPLTTGVGTYSDAIVPSHVVAGSQFNTNNYEITFKNGSLTVEKAPLTIIANSTNRVYGATLELTGTEFTTEPATLPNGETVDAVTLTSTKAGDSAAEVKAYPEDIKPEAIVSSTINPDNYAITFSNGTLTVTKASLTIIANSTNLVYGTTLAFAGTEFTTEPAELPNGETVETVTITCAEAAVPTTPAGEYAIVPSHVVTGSQFNTNNYDIAFSNGTLTVEKRAITLKADDAEKTYGEAKTFGEKDFDVTSGELVNGDTIDSVSFASAGAAATAPYAAEGSSIVASNAQGTGVANYDITYEPGKLTFKKFALTITANDMTNCYGEASSFLGTEFTVSPTTLPNDERVETVTLTNVQPIDAEVGEYDDAIVPSLAVTGINANNYDITFSNGTLTVTQAMLTVSVNDVRWTVGSSRPAYGYEDFSGQLRAGDSVADITGESVTFTNAVWQENVPSDADAGTYSNEIWVVRSSLNGARAGNYTIEIDPGDLIVVKRPPEPSLPTLYVSAISVSKAYGTKMRLSDLEFIASITGTNGTQVVTGIDVAFTDAQGRSADPTSAAAEVGTYKIILSNIRGFDTRDFSNVVYNPGTLTVTQSGTPVVPSADVRLSDHDADAVSQADTTVKNVYDGLLFQETGLAGTIQVKIPTANRRTGLAKLSATVTASSGKKITVTGTFDPNADRFVATAKDGTVLDLVIGKDGFYGTFGDSAVEGARNRYSSKAADDKEVVKVAQKWVGSYSVVCASETGWDTLSATVSKNGSVKVTGELASGSKISLKSQLIVGVEGYCIPVFLPKKDLSLCLLFSDEGLTVEGAGSALVGRAQNLADASALALDADDIAALADDGNTKVLTDYLPEGVDVVKSGKKWIVMPDENGKALRMGRLVWNQKAGGIDLERSKIDGYNVSGLKLTFTEKTGVFSGSFKVYSVAKNRLTSTTVSVKGVVLDGIGYGTAFSKKLGNIRLMLVPREADSSL